MKKKILIISPTPTHPQNSGNRSRVYFFLETLRRLGYKIHFIYCYLDSSEKHVKEKSDLRLMSKTWDKFSVFIPGVNKMSIYEQINYLFCKFKCFFYKCVGLAGEQIKKVHSLYKILKPFFKNRDLQFQLTLKEKSKLNSIDSVYPEFFDHYVKSFCGRRRYDAVIVEYVYLSKVLELFSDNVLKIIDTHDIFTNRKEKVKEKEWFSTTKSEEAKGLNRADIVIAIQEKEAEFFKRIVNKDVKVVTIGYQVKLIKSKRKKFQKRILFVGSGTKPNILGIKFFIKDVLPLLKKEIPDVELFIAGEVCKFIPDSNDYKKLNEVKDLDNIYKETGLVIAPIFSGTGLKIKVIEALGHGKVVVATKHSTEGLEKLTKLSNSPLLMANTPDEFVSQIKKIFKDKDYILKIKNAYQFIKDYNARIELEIKDMLNVIK